MNLKNFKFDVDTDGIALVTWDMPGRSMNVFTIEVMNELSEIVEKVAADKDIKGAVIAGLLIGIAEALTRTYQPQYAAWLGANFDVVVPYVIMIVVLMVRPYGLFGTPEVERV